MWHVYPLERRTIAEIHAVEDLLLEQAKNDGRCSLMFSCLERPGISISANQNLVKDVDVERAQTYNVDIVRRRTGGRTVYFDDNFLVVSVAHPKTGATDVIRNYERICGAITETLADIIGREVTLENRNDFIVKHRGKIGGAAQRDTGAVLVHSYIRYDTDLAKMLPFLRIDGVSLVPYRSVIEELVDSVKRYASSNFPELYARIKKGLVQHLCREDIREQRLTSGEEREIGDRARQYSDPRWVQGTGEEPSRGHCDIIADKTLLIPDLVGKVSYA